MTTTYTGEAAVARPLAEHAARAREAYSKIAALAVDGDSKTGKPITREQLDTLRAAAVQGFWLYPLVEAASGLPGGNFLALRYNDGGASYLHHNPDVVIS